MIHLLHTIIVITRHTGNNLHNIALARLLLGAAFGEISEGLTALSLLPIPTYL